jgi:hypothetical protein
MRVIANRIFDANRPFMGGSPPGTRLADRKDPVSAPDAPQHFLQTA